MTSNRGEKKKQKNKLEIDDFSCDEYENLFERQKGNATLGLHTVQPVDDFELVGHIPLINDGW